MRFGREDLRTVLAYRPAWQKRQACEGLISIRVAGVELGGMKALVVAGSGSLPFLHSEIISVVSGRRRIT